MLFWILVVLLFLSLGGGSFGYGRFGAAGMSPAGVVLVVLAVLWLSGNL